MLLLPPSTLTLLTFSSLLSLTSIKNETVIADAKDLAARAVDSLRIPEDFSTTEEEKRASRNSLAALLAADPLAGASLPWPAATAEAFASSSGRRRGSKSPPCAHNKKNSAMAAPADEDVLEALDALAAVGADSALFAPILERGGEEAPPSAAIIAVDVDEAADGAVEAAVVSVSPGPPLSPSSTLSSSSHLDAALDIQYGEGTTGALAVTRRVANWVSALGDSPALVASLSSSSPSSLSSSSFSSSSSLDAARDAFDAAADAIETVGASLAAALESRPGADDAELDLAVAVDLVGGRGGREPLSSNSADGIVDVRIEASVVPGSRITRAMLEEALDVASYDAVAAAGAAGVEVIAARVDVFDDDDEENDILSSSLFSYSQSEDAYCLFLGSYSGYDRWACARRAPLSRVLAVTSLFFAAASAVAAFNALVPVSDDDNDDSDSESEGEEQESDEEATMFIKPALWALDSKA